MSFDWRRGRSFAIGITIAALLLGAHLLSRRRGCGYSGPTIGSLAPDFSLPIAGGATLRLSSLQGQVVLLDFWASWCRPCLRKLPTLYEWQRKYGPSGFRVLAINVENRPDVVARFLSRESAIAWLVGSEVVANRYGVRSIPHMTLVDRQGQVASVQVGGRSVARFEQHIRRLTQR